VQPKGGECECGTPKCKRAHPPGSTAKHPRLASWEKEASSDDDTIAAWMASWPDANIGVATGAASGFFVLDVDPDHGGEDSLALLEQEHGQLPDTPRARTGSGGTHYLFRLPVGGAVTNSAGRVGKGLDIRGDGGQIVVAPSRSAKGPYRWIRAPWDVELAEAPAWLLAQLRRAAPRSAQSSDRGYFPAASPEVLAAAAADLEAHGPAVDGDGGGLHTVHAAAILTHDYALTDDEAWPLLEEWNATCRPPWEPDDLRVMLGRGRKYGKLEYGCKRSMDAVQAALKLIADWQDDGDPIPLVERVRPLAAICGDLTRRAIIERELAAATSLKPRALALPKPAVAAAPAKPGEILVSPDVHRVADDALRAIAPKVFARNGVLCEVVRAERTFISDLEPARVVDLMSQTAVYVRHDESKGPVQIAPPAPVAAIVHARRTLPGVRVLEAVTTAPVFLADGSILQDRGYNAQARVYLEPDVDVFVDEDATREDAIEAVATFRDLLSEVPFASPADFSSWLAALLSPLVKSATSNAPAPMLCISASSPGAGKTMLANLVGRIITGSPAEVRPYSTRDANEWSKRITSYIRAGSPVSAFDNVNGPVGDEVLDRLLTASTWSDRILGASEAPPIPIVTTWIATGNNIEPVGDTVRRVMMCRIVVDTERPQERVFRVADLESHVTARRSEYLSAALTILRAYHVAGRPSQRLPAWGSFGAWSSLVREAIVWAGCVDPFETQRAIALNANEPEIEAHEFWIDVIAATSGYADEIALTANQRSAQEVLGARDGITAHSLRRFVARFIDKPRGGRRIRKQHDPRTNRPIYIVEHITARTA